MPELQYVTVGVITKAPMEERERQSLGQAIGDYVEIAAPDDVEISEVVFHHVHKHHSTEERSCRPCRLFAGDERHIDA